MNLVAKEYIASKTTSMRGVLILSEMAGAVHELTDALIVNPHDVNNIMQAIVQALKMKPDEQQLRLERMQEKLKRYDVSHWAVTFIEEQKRLMKSQRHPHINRLSGPSKKQMLEAYQNASKRLILLDYDGTLMPFHPDPMAVVPDDSLLQILQKLKTPITNKLVINSGRDRQTLQQWLGPLEIDMAAEHGVWIKKNGSWKKNEGLSFSWKKEVRALLENLVRRTPGSFIEEKDFSIVMALSSYR